MLGVFAQPSSLVNGKIPVTTKLDKKTITFSWPILSGKFGLYQQPASYNGEWKLVPTDLYRTNGATVSVSQPIPAKTTLYLVKHVFRGSPPLAGAKQAGQICKESAAKTLTESRIIRAVTSLHDAKKVQCRLAQIASLPIPTCHS